jgi:hypothetical protein
LIDPVRFRPSPNDDPFVIRDWNWSAVACHNLYSCSHYMRLGQSQTGQDNHE